MCTIVAVALRVAAAVAVWGMIASCVPAADGASAMGSVLLAWDANPEPDIAGYRVYYGEAAGIYPNSTDVGNVTTAKISGLEVGRRHCFVVVAYNASGLESLPSEEVSVVLSDEIVWNLDLVADPAVGGEVQGGGIYPDGAVVEVSALANEGWRFVEWVGDTGIVEEWNRSVAMQSLPIGGNTQLRAVFVRMHQLDLDTIDARMGTVEGGGVYDAGSKVKIKATPQPGFVFAGWEGIELSENTPTVTVTLDQAYALRATFRDIQSPTITGIPGALSKPADAGSTFARVEWSAPSATDNLEVSTFTSSHSPGAVLPLGTTTVTYTATDAVGNSTTASFEVTVTDTEAPQFSGVPSGTLVAIDGNSEATVAVSWLEPTVTDNDAVTAVTSSHRPGDLFAAGSTEVTYTATDASGNQAAARFSITVIDTRLSATVFVDEGDVGNQALALSFDPPLPNKAMISCVTADGTATSGLDYAEVDEEIEVPAGTTRIPVPVTILEDVNLEGDEDFTLLISAQLERAGEGALVLERSATITIRDRDRRLEVVTNDARMGTVEGGGIYDAGSKVKIKATPQPGFVFAGWEGIELSENTPTVTVTLEQAYALRARFRDVQSPTITGIPGALSKPADAGSTSARVEWSAPVATDNFEVTTLTSSHSPGAVLPLGTTTVTYTATDAAGNSTTASFEVTVTDTEAPKFVGVPADILAVINTTTADPGLRTGRGVPVSWTEPTAVDNDRVDSLVTSHRSGERFPPGGTKVTSTATDASGNEAIAMFTVTVLDLSWNDVPGGTTVNEGDASAVVHMAFNLPVPDGVTLSCETVDGSAVAGRDFVANNESFDVPKGTTAFGIPVTILEDDSIEGDETFAIRIVVTVDPRNEGRGVQMNRTVPITIRDGGTGYDAWAQVYGLNASSARSDADADINADGFSNLFHYLQGISPHAFIPAEHPGLQPDLDVHGLENRPTFYFSLPATLPGRIKVNVQVSDNGAQWFTVASRGEGTAWEVARSHLLLESESVGGRRKISVAPSSELTEVRIQLYRLNLAVQQD
ncbi:MAG: HYR domain-containing protein [Verrucomicrobiales bacterium]